MASSGPARRGMDTSLVEAFGGVRGMVDMTVPGLVFLVVYTVGHDLTASCIAALGVTLALAVVRLARRETLKHAFGGVMGVGIGAFIAYKSGKAQDFYLPGMIYGVVIGVVYLISNLVRWPLIGVLLGPVLGENMTWRTRNPGRLKAYTQATWVWVALFAIRAAILFPLYWTGNVTALGIAKIALGVPPWLVAIYLSWLILSKAPPPIKVLVEEEREAEEDDERAHEEQAEADGAATSRQAAVRRRAVERQSEAEQEFADRYGEEAEQALERELSRAVDHAVTEELGQPDGSGSRGTTR